MSVVLIGNTFIALGLMQQKRVHRKDPSHRRRDLCCFGAVNAYFLSPEWICGLAAFLAGHGFCMIGLALGTASVLACLNCWCVVVSLLTAPFLLGEAVSLFKVLAVMLVICGCIWVTLHGPQRYHVFTVGRLHTYFVDQAFLAAAGLSLLVACGLAGRAATTRQRPRCSVFQLTLAAAMCAWFAVLSAKCLSGLHFTTWHHELDQLGHWQAWAVVAVFVILAISNLHLLNLALAAGDAVTVMPMYEALSLLGQIVLGGIFFQEFRSLDTWGHLQFWPGVCCVLSGVVLVTRPDPDLPALSRLVLKPPAPQGGEA